MWLCLLRMKTLSLRNALVFIVSVLFTGQSFAAVWSINYPRPLSADDKRHLYPLAVLTLALDATGVRYKLSPSDRIILQAKAIRQLKENREVNVIWSMTNPQREQELLPVRIPIAKGLIGWRVAFIHEDDVERFSSVTSLRELLSFTAIQGRDWPDTKILQANGFNVLSVLDFPEARTALSRKEGDFFPRSVIEVMLEMESLDTGLDIVLNEEFLIQYPAAMYFFVNKSNKTLAKLIETGLRRAIASGEFDALFERSFKDVLAELRVGDRELFRLSNPLLPDEAPVDDASLWFDIND